jgi:hypothetical protein
VNLRPQASRSCGDECCCGSRQPEAGEEQSIECRPERVGDR